MPDKTHEAYYVDDTGQRFKFSYTGDVPPSREQVLASVKDQDLVNARGVGNGAGGKVADSLHAVFASPGDKTSFFPEASTHPVPYDQTRRDPNQIPVAPGQSAPALPPFRGNPDRGPAAIGSVVSHVSRSGVNFVQGFTGSVLSDYDNSVAGQNPSQNPFLNLGSILTAPGDAGKAVRAGGRAMWNDNGDEQVGKAVPDLAPNTLGGGIYNTAVDIGGDPLNFLGGGLNTVVSKEAITAHLAELMKMDGARDVPVGTSGDDAGKLAKAGEVAATVASAARPEIDAADLSKWGGISKDGLASRFPPGEVPLPDGPKALGPLPGPDGKVKNAFLLGHGSDGSSLVAYGEENLPRVINAGDDVVPTPKAVEANTSPVVPDPVPANAAPPVVDTPVDPSPYAIEDEHGNVIPDPVQANALPGEPLTPAKPVLPPATQPRDTETGRFVAVEKSSAPEPKGKTFGLPAGFKEPGAQVPAVESGIPGTPAKTFGIPEAFSEPTTRPLPAGTFSSFAEALPPTPTVDPGAEFLFSPPGALGGASKNPFAPGGEIARQVAQKASSAALRGYDAVDGTMRAAEYSTDLSATMRQGGVLGLTRPKQVAAAMVDQVKAIKEGKYIEGLSKIASRPNAPLYKRFGLAVPTGEEVASGTVYRREEAFAKSLLHDIPGVGEIPKASDRAMTAYLARLRSDAFDSTLAGWAKKGITPENSPHEVQALADWINTASGRGDLEKMEKAAPVLARLLSSPRLQASRLALLNPVTYIKMPPAARQIALRDAGAMFGSNVALLSLAAAYQKAHPDSGVSVTNDPRSPDFGWVRFGATKVDLTGGANGGAWIRLLAQVGTASRVDSSGKVHQQAPVDWKTEGKERYRGGTLGVFAEGRMAPLPALAWEIARGTDYNGEPMTVQGTIHQKFVPLVLQDAEKAFKEHGPLLGGTFAGLSALGAGVNTRTKPDDSNAPREPLPSEKLLPKPVPSPGDKYNDADY